jgi:hypothetical protein
MRKLIAKRVLASAAFVSIGLAANNFAAGEQVTYTIDPLESSLTLLGNFGGNAASQQTAGSLTTSYSGTIVADRGPGTINFDGGSSVDAAPQPVNQEPRSDGTPGAEQADYGRSGTVSSFFGDFAGDEAFRGWNFDFDTESDVPITLSATNTFNGNQFGTEVNSGEVAWEYGGSSFGVADGFVNDLSFNDAPPSSIEVIGDIEKLTLRIDATYGYTVAQTGDSTARFVGTIVATRTVVPEPSALGAVAVVGAALLSRRRRR